MQTNKRDNTYGQSCLIVVRVVVVDEVDEYPTRRLESVGRCEDGRLAVSWLSGGAEDGRKKK